MESRLHEHCRQSCIGPPAPRNVAIRMTKRNVYSNSEIDLRARTIACLSSPVPVREGDP